MQRKRNWINVKLSLSWMNISKPDQAKAHGKTVSELINI